LRIDALFACSEGFETPLPSVAAISILRLRNGGALDLIFFRFLFYGKPMVKKAVLVLVLSCSL
jgi:hypothetical protein